LGGKDLTSRVLLDRFRIACRFAQSIDRDRIRRAIRRWTDCHDVPQSVPIRFAESKEEAMRIALPYRIGGSGIGNRPRRRTGIWPQSYHDHVIELIRSAGVSGFTEWEESDWGALFTELSCSVGAAAWRGWDEWNEWAVCSRSASDHYIYDPRDWGWGLCTPVTFLIDAALNGDMAAVQRSLPLLEALEHACFCTWRVHDVIWAAALPGKVITDNIGRLDRVDGPPFEWLDDIRDFYWLGVRVPPFVVQ
jgi:hypothetical protein